MCLSLQRWFCQRSQQVIHNMQPPQVLEPVLNMKVDELFLNWLSAPTTQAVLKDYLDLIKKGQNIDLGCVDTKDKRLLTVNKNNNVVSKRNLAERVSAPLSAPSGPSTSHTLPSGSCSHARVMGPNGRALRRSVSTKKVKLLNLSWSIDELFRSKQFAYSSDQNPGGCLHVA